MTVSRKLRIVVLAGAVGLFGLGASERLVLPGGKSLISTAEAIVGRPLTPISFAGAARRTVRRCAVGVYYC
jgi:hypothetical protein